MDERAIYVRKTFTVFALLSFFLPFSPYLPMYIYSSLQKRPSLFALKGRGYGGGKRKTEQTEPAWEAKQGVFQQKPEPEATPPQPNQGDSIESEERSIVRSNTEFMIDVNDTYASSISDETHQSHTDILDIVVSMEEMDMTLDLFLGFLNHHRRRRHAFIAFIVGLRGFGEGGVIEMSRCSHAQNLPGTHTSLCFSKKKNFIRTKCS